jgi:hypothetical protein
LQAEFDADWEPTTFMCGWCHKWRYVDETQHYIDTEWKQDPIGQDKDARFECHKLCWLVGDQPEMKKGGSVGLSCHTPEQECCAPNPAAPSCEETQEKLAAIREWFIESEFLAEGCPDEEFEATIQRWFHLYLVATGKIAPEGLCANTLTLAGNDSEDFE